MASRPTTPHAARLTLVLPALLALAACGGGPPTVYLGREALLDPEACKTCHPAAYQEWSGSMHAYAAEDPVFRAMNQRGQRESGGALGDFCVKCHAPMAVREGLTTDGLNLDVVPAKFKGVTCYFCHAAEKVEGTHNNPIALAADGTLFGPFDDPVAGTPHRSTYSRLLDGATLESAAMCGSCHDIRNMQGAHVERTFQEWQETLFSTPPNGQGCASNCHMMTSEGPAATMTSKVRRLHAHDFPAVDLALTPFPETEAQRMRAQRLLDDVIQPTLCWNDLNRRLELTLENATAGHSWPSGATPDRRAWVELTAYAGDAVIYSSGGAAAFPLEASADPDLWLMRDCLFDGAGQEVHMFWEAATSTGNAVPGSVILNVNDPSSFNRTHPRKVYPAAGMLPMMPDRVSVKVHLQAIGDDVLADLVASGDLDPAIPPRIARFQLGGAAALEWTPATAAPRVDPMTSATLLCVVKPITYRANTVPAVSHARCQAP